MGKRILVTGAGGYIGRHVVSALCDKGAEVLTVDFRTDGIDNRAEILAENIFSGSKTIYQELGNPDVCIHMAWRNGFVHDSDAHMEDLSAHYRFLQGMIEGGLPQLAVMGTMHEVGYWEGAIDENTPCNPCSMYGIAKDALRRSVFLLAKKHGICLQWLRAYYIYGDDAKNHSIFTKLCEAEAAGKETFPFTSLRFYFCERVIPADCGLRDAAGGGWDHQLLLWPAGKFGGNGGGLYPGTGI